MYVDQLTGIFGDTGETKQRDAGGHVTDDQITFPTDSDLDSSSTGASKILTGSVRQQITKFESYGNYQETQTDEELLMNNSPWYFTEGEGFIKFQDILRRRFGSGRFWLTGYKIVRLVVGKGNLVVLNFVFSFQSLRAALLAEETTWFLDHLAVTKWLIIKGIIPDEKAGIIAQGKNVELVEVLLKSKIYRTLAWARIMQSPDQKKWLESLEPGLLTRELIVGMLESFGWPNYQVDDEIEYLSPWPPLKLKPVDDDRFVTEFYVLLQHGISTHDRSEWERFFEKTILVGSESFDLVAEKAFKLFDAKYLCRKLIYLARDSPSVLARNIEILLEKQVNVNDIIQALDGIPVGELVVSMLLQAKPDQVSNIELVVLFLSNRRENTEPLIRKYFKENCVDSGEILFGIVPQLLGQNILSAIDLLDTLDVCIRNRQSLQTITNLLQQTVAQKEEHIDMAFQALERDDEKIQTIASKFLRLVLIGEQESLSVEMFVHALRTDRPQVRKLANGLLWELLRYFHVSKQFLTELLPHCLRKPADVVDSVCQILIERTIEAKVRLVPPESEESILRFFADAEIHDKNHWTTLLVKSFIYRKISDEQDLDDRTLFLSTKYWHDFDIVMLRKLVERLASRDQGINSILFVRMIRIQGLERLAGRFLTSIKSWDKVDDLVSVAKYFENYFSLETEKPLRDFIHHLFERWSFRNARDALAILLESIQETWLMVIESLTDTRRNMMFLSFQLQKKLLSPEWLISSLIHNEAPESLIQFLLIATDSSLSDELWTEIFASQNLIKYLDSWARNHEPVPVSVVDKQIRKLLTDNGSAFNARTLLRKYGFPIATWTHILRKRPESLEFLLEDCLVHQIRIPAAAFTFVVRFSKFASVKLMVSCRPESDEETWKAVMDKPQRESLEMFLLESNIYPPGLTPVFVRVDNVLPVSPLITCSYPLFQFFIIYLLIIVSHIPSLGLKQCCSRNGQDINSISSHSRLIWQHQ